MKLQRKIYATRREKIIDLVIGIVVFVILNALVAGLLVGWSAVANNFFELHSPPAVIPAVTLCLNIVPFAVNIGLIVLFAFWRPWIALGMAAGIGIAMILTLCLGVVAGAACLVLLSQTGQ